MPEYEYIDRAGHAVTLTTPMHYSTAVVCDCGLTMWRKPHALAVNWAGLKPSQGFYSTEMQKFFDETPERREQYEREKELGTHGIYKGS